MAHGRKVDQDVQRFSKEEKTLSELCPDARAVVKKLREKQWRIMQCQYRVENTNARTWIDILCVDPEGTRVILELKSSLQTFDAFSRGYHVPDHEFPAMADNTPNTKYWRHQKQLWGNMRLWTQQEGTCVKIRGYVLVVCRQKVALVPLDRRLLSVEEPK